VSLRDLEQEGLIQRRVVDSKPIKSFYSLTEKGADVAKALQQVNILMNNEKHSKK
jgi:DNA-binding HxlR family transcriptional regulator